MKPRDYRDDADVDDTLDLVRVSDRVTAMGLFRAALDIAHQQGMVAGIECCIKALREENR